MTSPEFMTRERLPKRVSGLEINTIEGGFMVYQPDKSRVHYLNHTAVLVLELCNGRNTVAQIAELIQNTYGLPASPESEVVEMMARMESEALVYID